MVLATDAHHPVRRPPLLAEAREAAGKLVGAIEAGHMVRTRPQGVVEDIGPDQLPPPLRATPSFVLVSSAQVREGSGLKQFLRSLRGR
jgi:protein-tyrosine phosphatase